MQRLPCVRIGVAKYYQDYHQARLIKLTMIRWKECCYLRESLSNGELGQQCTWARWWNCRWPKHSPSNHCHFRKWYHQDCGGIGSLLNSDFDWNHRSSFNEGHSFHHILTRTVGVMLKLHLCSWEMFTTVIVIAKCNNSLSLSFPSLSKLVHLHTYTHTHTYNSVCQKKFDKHHQKHDF